MHARVSITFTLFVALLIQSNLLADRPGNPDKIDKDSKAYVDDHIHALKGMVTTSSNEIERLKTEIYTLKKIRSPSDDGLSSDNPPNYRYPWEIWLAIVILGIVMWMRTGSKAIAATAAQKQAATDSALPKCPRCGQEHDPGDTICKNPNCKTQF